MLVVCYGRIHPASHACRAKAFGIQFPAQMSIYVVNNGKQEENGHMRYVHRNAEIKQNDNSIFQNRLQGMKSIGRPR